jgi:hypothetical protein
MLTITKIEWINTVTPETIAVGEEFDAEIWVTDGTVEFKIVAFSCTYEMLKVGDMITKPLFGERFNFNRVLKVEDQPTRITQTDDTWSYEVVGKVKEWNPDSRELLIEFCNNILMEVYLDDPFVVLQKGDTIIYSADQVSLDG